MVIEAVLPRHPTVANVSRPEMKQKWDRDLSIAGCSPEGPGKWINDYIKIRDRA